MKITRLGDILYYGVLYMLKCLPEVKRWQMLIWING
nr:MAG TPA: hypothetical protein [Caudoviricetes sp.]